MKYGIVPLLILVAFLLGGAGCSYVEKRPPLVACTMEAQLCPDGSYVSRQGPDCAFAPCPGGETPPLDCSGPGGQCSTGYTCIQKCGPPVVREDEPPPGYYCERNEIASKPRNCPICLASNAKISTPNGDVNIKSVEVGTRVWSMNARGEKVASTVVAVVHADVPKTHQVMHLVLSDGRDVWVSPNHPTANGLLVGNLRVGELYDGTLIRSTDLVPYWDDKTYDLLPDSDTGDYWANGILLGSTLFSRR